MRIKNSSLIQIPVLVSEKAQSSTKTDEVPGIGTKEVDFHFLICHLFYTDTKETSQLYSQLGKHKG